MNITLLRQTWNLIETTNAWELLEGSESDMIQRLLQRLDAQKPLADQERTSISDYLQAKISLIRDTAESRLVSA
ncbi:MAG: hypothetical protein RLZZ74_1621 [Cyanobacteriota bacterium]